MLIVILKIHVKYSSVFIEYVHNKHIQTVCQGRVTLTTADVQR